ncbi:Glucose and ribitol dehydrogenase 1, partial [Tetrabaena socialis]
SPFRNCRTASPFRNRALQFTRTTAPPPWQEFGRIDVLVNNAGEQHLAEDVAAMEPATVQRTFRTNIYSQIFLCRAAWPHLKRGASIINTSSVAAYSGHPQLLDYSATKGAITSFTRALHMAAITSGIRVNAVAPGPIWTPLIPASFPDEKVQGFGTGTTMGRAGQPAEVAPSYVFLASEDSSYISGQSLHPNGGRVVNA